jgi:PhnB protein
MTTIQPIVQPYLFFGGNCEEALQFYQKSISAEIIMLMRYSEAPEGPPEGMLAPGYENKVMHASFRVGGTTLMASDGCGEAPSFGGFMLSISTPDEAECRRFFDALSDGGSVEMPLGKTFWSPLFGMTKDRFGVGWMVTVGE